MTRQNDKIIRDKLAKDPKLDISQALKLMEQMVDPWYKTQALSQVAVLSKNPKQQLKILEQAFESAQNCPDKNRIVTVSAWPLDALFKLGLTQEFYDQTIKLNSLIQRDAFSISRGSALARLCMTTVKAPKVFSVVIKNFLDTSNHRHFWRFDRDCYHLALAMKNQAYPDQQIQTVLDHIKKPRIKKKAERALKSDIA